MTESTLTQQNNNTVLPAGSSSSNGQSTVVESFVAELTSIAKALEQMCAHLTKVPHLPGSAEANKAFCATHNSTLVTEALNQTTQHLTLVTTTPNEPTQSQTDKAINPLSSNTNSASFAY